MKASGVAPGKVILVGEHAVVYSRPAIAVPVWETQATATIVHAPIGSGCVIYSRDSGLQTVVAAAEENDALALAVRLTLDRLHLNANPDWVINIASEIPIASGMGSGAAVSAALVRAIYEQAGEEPEPAAVSALVYACEEIYHGTPSGIDNTVVAYGQPVWFVRGSEPIVFKAARPFMLAIADSGVPSSTRRMVDGVRQRRAAAQVTYDAWFDEIGEIACAARQAIECGEPAELGPLFDRNQTLLERIGVSSPLLESLIKAAIRAGAGGAKLSGGGGGGNVIALVTVGTADAVREALLAAGAKRVIVTSVAG